MFIIIEYIPEYRARFFRDREKHGISSEVRVAAEGTIYLTHEAAETWVKDATTYYLKKQQPRTFTILEIPTI